MKNILIAGALVACSGTLFGCAPSTRPAASAAMETPRQQAAAPEPKDTNILAAANGGQVLAAPHDQWQQTIDGKEGKVYDPAYSSAIVWWFRPGEEAVFAFKDEQPATFHTFAVLIPAAGENVKEVELLVGNDSPTGTFRSIGRFQIQNLKMMKSPYQEFKFQEVTAKYLKVKLLSSYAETALALYEFRLLGKLGGTVQAATAPAPRPQEPKRINILAAANGGQVLAAPHDQWRQTIDGKEGKVYDPAYSSAIVWWFRPGEQAVFAFRDEKPMRFDTFGVLIPAAGENVKEVELLVGNDSPTGTFRSIGKFQVQNLKMMKSPYQEFKFREVKAKYLKVKLLSGYRGNAMSLYEFQLVGTAE